MTDRARAAAADDLLKPSFADRAPVDADAKRPWRLGSQAYVAFFGGSLAVAAIALVNARRLGLTGSALTSIVLLGLAGLILELPLLVAIVDAGGGEPVRFVSRGIALLAWGGMYLLQREADRRYHHFHHGDDEPYGRMFIPGVIATAALGMVEVVIVGMVTGY